jgi:DNA-binding transcriptional LysR family regulator
VLFPALTALLERSSTGAEGPGLDLRFRTAQEVLRQVETGDVDLGVVYLAKVSNYLTFHPVYDEELVLIAAPAMLRAERGRRDLGRLAAYESLPFVTYLEGDYVFGRWFDAIFGAQPAATTSVHQFDELEEVVATVALGHGASVVPLDCARGAIARRQVRVVRPARAKRCVNRVFAVTRAGTFLRREFEDLLTALRR